MICHSEVGFRLVCSLLGLCICSFINAFSISPGLQTKGQPLTEYGKYCININRDYSDVFVASIPLFIFKCLFIKQFK